MTVMPKVKAEVVTTDVAHVGDCIGRVFGVLRCPFCLRSRLRASSLRDVGDSEYALTCAHCHRDVLTITRD